MDNLEIVFKDFPKENLDEFIKIELLKPKNKLRFLNFFDNIKKKDLTLPEISSFSKILSPTGCANISFLTFEFGESLGNAVVTFSFDENIGDIVINFEIGIFSSNNESAITNKCIKILEYIFYIKNKYLIPIVLVGFESTNENDNLLLLSDSVNLEKAVKKLSSTLLRYLN